MHAPTVDCGFSDRPGQPGRVMLGRFGPTLPVFLIGLWWVYIRRWFRSLRDPEKRKAYYAARWSHKYLMIDVTYCGHYWKNPYLPIQEYCAQWGEPRHACERKGM